MKTPKGGDRRPTFHSRRFCRSVCGRTKSFRRSRNVKGNFAWGSYGGFSAGSWRVLGTFSAESRHDLGEISRPLTMRSLIREFKGFASPWAPFGLHFGSLWLTLGSLLAPFGFLWAPLGLSLAPLSTSSPAEGKFRRDLAKILPRFCRERAENPPRTRREPAV